MKKMSESEFRRRAASVLLAVERGEAFTITRDGEPFARLVPMTAPRRRWVVRAEPETAGEVSKAVRVRPKARARAMAVVPATDDLDDLLKDVKARRRELSEALKSAKARRGEEEAPTVG